MATYEDELTSEDEIDNFKPVFKQYKRRDRPLDISSIIDFDNENNLDKVKDFQLNEPQHIAPQGLKSVSEWKAYSLRDHPGFLFIVNPFLTGYQRYWVNRCVKDYPKRPNVRNLDAYMKVEDKNIWEASVLSHKKNITSKESLMMKLRWVTMGYHYDWGTKKYYKDRIAPFPEDMAELGRYIAATIGYPKFSPEAAVLNYYHLDSALSGHTDHSEFDHSAPLLSFSFGQDAIFLIGGETKETTPSAVFLRSGDICVMSGEARLCYHAVPRIMSTSSSRTHKCFDLPSDWSVRNGGSVCNNQDCCTNQSAVDTDTRCNCAAEAVKDDVAPDRINCEDWNLVAEYLTNTRINFNIRQVLPPDRQFPVEA